MPQPNKSSRRFSFFGLNSTPSAAADGSSNINPPQLKLEADREVYGPGNFITVTIEVKNIVSSSSLLIENLAFEVKGIEKLDAQWFNTPKPSPDSKQRRGAFFYYSLFMWIIFSIVPERHFFCLIMWIQQLIELIGSYRMKMEISSTSGKCGKEYKWLSSVIWS